MLNSVHNHSGGEVKRWQLYMNQTSADVGGTSRHFPNCITQLKWSELF